MTSEKRSFRASAAKGVRMAGHAVFYPAFHAWFLLCFLPLVALGLGWQLLARGLLRATRLGRRYKMASGPDATCLLPSVDRAGNRTVISCFAVIDGRVDGDEMRRRAERAWAAVDAGDDADDAVDAETKAVFAKLRFYPVRRFGFYLWKLDEDMDIGRHYGPIRRADGTEATYRDEAELREILTQEWNRPFPENSPLWRAFWIRKSESACAGRPETCMGIQMHHCMGDGVSFCYAVLPRIFDFDMQSAVLRHVRHSAAAAAGFDDDKSQGRDSGVAVTLDDSMAVSTSSSENCFDDDDDEGGGGGGVMEGGSRDAGDDNEEFRREMKKLRPSGWTVFKTFAIGILGIPGAVLRLRTRPDHNPLAARPLTGRKLFHWLDPISMERLKGLQSRLGGGFTINDIISTATSRALWRYMFNHCPMEVGPERVDDDLEAQRSLCTEGQSPDQAPRSKETRNWLLSDAATVAFWTKFPDKFKNRFGLCRLRSRPPRILTGDAHFAQAAAAAAAAASGDGDYSAALRRSALADLVARRREIRRFLKDRNLGFAQYAAANMAPQCLPVWMADLLMRPPHRGVTYVTSNVKGPPSKIMVQGVNVDRIFAFPPQLGTSGISVMTFGYEKDLLMSIIADTGYLPTAGDVALLGKYVVDEIAVLEDAATFESPSLLRRNETVVLDIETV